MEHRPVNHPDDLVGLRQLFEACRAADGHAPIGEQKYLDLLGGNLERSIGRVFDEGNQFIAYVHAIPRIGDDVWVLEAALHPDHRDSVFVREVLATAVDLAINAGAGTVRLWVYHPAVEAVVKELKFHEERQLLQMRLPLPPRFKAVAPGAVRIATFRVGTDEDSWIEVNNRAFAGHPENGSWNRSILADRMNQDWFDPEGVLMAWKGSRLAGFCWTKVHPAPLGEIYVIAVDPDYQGQSLGTWLTLEGLRYLSGPRNRTTAMLYVDAANRRAVGMYERLGFDQDHMDRSYVRHVGDQPETGAPNARSHEGQA